MSDDQNIDGTVRIPVSSIYSFQSVIRRDVFSQIQGPGAPQKIAITKEHMIIGRSPDVDIQMRSNLVSRRHVELSREGSELICRDLKNPDTGKYSHNGLLLNGLRVHSVALRDGDTIQIGDIVLLFHQGVQWTSS